MLQQKWTSMAPVLYEILRNKLVIVAASCSSSTWDYDQYSPCTPLARVNFGR